MTNFIPNLLATAVNATDTPPQAGQLVALGVGAFLAHAYHAIVRAGGVKRLWRAFWDGPADVGTGTQEKGPR